MSRPRRKPAKITGHGAAAAQAASRARTRTRTPKQGDDDWRPVGPDGKSRVRFARDDFDAATLEKFMGMLADGIALDTAAAGIDSTATAIRAYRRREPAFDEQVVKAIDDGKLAYQDRLRTTSRARATNATNGSDRMLEVELATHVPEYAHLRRDRLQVDGKVRHEFAIAFDPAALAALPVEKLRELREILSALDGDIVIEGKARPARELAAGE